MNVLLLNMSTLRQGTYYSIVDPIVLKSMETKWNQEITYHGQMEPVPVFLINVFQERGEKLDHIIVMNTPETINKGKSEIVTAYDFFVSQIEKACDELNVEHPLFTSFTFENGSRDGKKLDEEQTQYSFLTAVSKAVNYLRKLKESTDKFDLYLDVHGGPRSMAYMNVAIVNLLNDEKIIPKMNLTVKDRENVNVKYTYYIIENDSLSTDMLDFTASMRNFLLYGRAEGLKEYSGLGNLNAANQRFLNIVYDVSDAIMTCDVNAFEASLKELRKELEKEIVYEGTLEIFKNNIRSSYGKLLTDTMTTFDQVDWCVQKGFIQQALTLIEAHMGEYLYNQFFEDKSVYCYKKNGVLITVDREKWSKKVAEKVKEHIQENRYWEDLTIRLFSKWADANMLIQFLSEDSDGPSYLETNWNGENLTQNKKRIKRILEIGNGENDLKLVERLVLCPTPAHLDREDPNEVHLPMYQGYFEKDEKNRRETVKEIYLAPDTELNDDIVEKEGVLVRFELKPGLNFDQKVTLHKVLYLHFILVQYRNEIMHASTGKHVPTKVLREDMEQYVKWIKTLF